MKFLKKYISAAKDTREEDIKEIRDWIEANLHDDFFVFMKKTFEGIKKEYSDQYPDTKMDNEYLKELIIEIVDKDVDEAKKKII